MVKIAYKYKSDVLQPLIEVNSVIDKLGEIWYSVEYLDNDTRKCNARFKKMSSVIDFISSNFR